MLSPGVYVGAHVRCFGLAPACLRAQKGGGSHGPLLPRVLMLDHPAGTVATNPDRAPSLGLTNAEAATLLARYGANEVAREHSLSPLRALAAQFTSPLIALLGLACVLAAALGDVADATAILAIVLLNGLVGFVQEYRAERSILALRSLTAPRARVMRDERVCELTAIDVVPGDLLVLEAGDVVAADARLVEAHALLTNEAPLTGESTPVEKSTHETGEGTALAERRDFVFMGTSVARGTGRARVTATGMQTELGAIARLLASTQKDDTPLQKQLAVVSHVLLYACVAIVLTVAGLGIARGQPPLEMMLVAVALAVAAVPEGLPAVVTIALAIGVQRMAARNVWVRKLAAVETLGCATAICTDKTGTLTAGVMRVRELWGTDSTRLLDAAAACCDSELDASAQGGVGDPTEIALLAAAAERGIERAAIERARPRTHVEPFDSERRRMAVARTDGVLYVKGAPEAVLPLCRSVTAGANEAAERMTEAGLRVLAVATGAGPREEALELVGLIGIADPPRAEAVEAVRTARAAGIETVMITGDHPRTALAIAREIGIAARSADGTNLVHARATPEDKLRIVRAWKELGHVVAMTGDGVNDAPALREAHVGIAMGRTGTQVTREASDIVLADDNFASIVAGVREGRGIFDNIQKALVYLLAGNASELSLMLAAAALGLPLPLLPLQLLWINLVTDGLPALALVMDPVQADVMARPPRRPSAPILGRPEWSRIAAIAVMEGSVTLGVFAWALTARDLDHARTLAFSTIVLAELFRVFSARSPTRVLWQLGAFSNWRLLAVVLLQVALQVALHHVPMTRELFGLTIPTPSEILLVLGSSLLPVSALELWKLARRQRPGRAAVSVPDAGKYM